MEEKLVISNSVYQLLSLSEDIYVNDIRYYVVWSKYFRRTENPVLQFNNNLGYIINSRAVDWDNIHYSGTKTLNCFNINDNNKLTAFQVGKNSLTEVKVNKLISLLITRVCTYEHDTEVYDEELINKIIKKWSENLGTILKSFGLKFEPKISKDIMSIYNLSTHDLAGIKLKKSCARLESKYPVVNYIEAYHYIDNVCILYNTMDGKLLYRALLWDALDIRGNKIKVLDRVYGTELDEFLLIRWAKERGYCYRDNFNNNEIYDKDDNLVEFCEVEIEDTIGFDTYIKCLGHPYFDTFCAYHTTALVLLCSRYNKLKYSTHEDNNNIQYLTSCMGDSMGAGITYYCFCGGCERGLFEHEIVRSPRFGPIYCKTCYDRLFTKCINCDKIIQWTDGTIVSRGCVCNECQELYLDPMLLVGGETILI
jgi:hypothetical protein